MTTNILKEKIMQRVRVIYMLRRLLPATVVEIGVLCLGLIVSTSFVSFNDILANLKGVGIGASFVDYAVSAVTQTEFTVQAVLVVFLASSSYFLYRMTKTASLYRRSYTQA